MPRVPSLINELNLIRTNNKYLLYEQRVNKMPFWAKKSLQYVGEPTLAQHNLGRL